MRVRNLRVVDVAVVIQTHAMTSKLLQDGLRRLFELGRCLSHLLDDFLVRKVLQTIVNMSALMEDLKKPFSSLQKTLLDGGETLTLFISCRWVLNDLVKDRFVVPDSVGASLRVDLRSLLIEDIFDALASEGCILPQATLLFFILLQELLLPLILRTEELGHVPLEALDFERAFQLGDLLETIGVGLTAVVVESDAAEDAQLLFLLVDGLAQVLLHYLEGFLLGVALVHEVSLLLYENSRRVGNLHNAAVANVHACCLWEVLDLGVFLVELREQYHIILMFFNLFTAAARVPHKSSWREELLDLVAGGLPTEAPFKPDLHLLFL